VHPRAEPVRPRADYVLERTFTNGEVGLYACRPLLSFGAFDKLSEPANFRRAHGLTGAVCRPDGQHICPIPLNLASDRSLIRGVRVRPQGRAIR